MSAINDQEYIDFTDGDLQGWELHPWPQTTIEQEDDNYFLRSDNPYSYNGMALRKDIAGLEVGKYYELTMNMRTHDQGKIMGLQVILGNDFPGAHVALRIELEGGDIKPGKWQKLKGFIYKKNAVTHDQVLLDLYSFYKLDVDNILISLQPTTQERVHKTEIRLGAQPNFKR